MPTTVADNGREAAGMQSHVAGRRYERLNEL
jgi:hypothetical protein